MKPARATIIVVEDERGARMTLCGILEEAGYRVIGLEKGSEALGAIRRDGFNIVITDIRLPDVGGMEILELAKEINPDAAVIMITGYASVETAVDAVNQGAYAYFVKPVSPDEIKTTIANALRHQRLLQENKRLVDSLQHSNKLICAANEELRNEITERKKAEEVLRESEEKYRTIFNKVPATIIALGKDGQIIDISPYHVAIIGKGKTTAEDYVGINIMTHPVIKKAGLSELYTKLFQGQPFDLKDVYYPVTSGGTDAYFNIRGTPIFKEGKVSGAIIIQEDITERKQIERKLQLKNEQLDVQNEALQSQGKELVTQQQELIKKTRELEMATQAKSEFLAHMSHELRTPLNVIIGFSELMTDEVPGKINEEQQQCLSDILGSGKHLLNLINNILDLSKIEAGKMELRLGKFALIDLLEPLKRVMMPIMTPKQQHLEIEIEEGLPQVYADRAKIRQVVLNLLGNSTRFTPDGGELRLEAVRDGDWCQVNMIDNGIGIKKENQKQIFEPFCQLDSPLSEGKGGTGLGLTIARQIIERHGGQIWVESEPGTGSKFAFTLPLANGN